MTEGAEKQVHVPLFRSLAVEQRNRGDSEWNSQRNVVGTGGLKALAQAVLQRNRQWNQSGTAAAHSCSTPHPPVEQESTPALAPERSRDANTKDPFEERAAV